MNAVGSVSQADRGQIVDALRDSLNMHGSTWPDMTNPYVLNASDRIRSDSKAIPSGNEGQFRRYMASSVVLHCADSLSFLGRAFGSILSGNTSTAGHLAYYSELRSASAILASEGIFIGNGANFVVPQAGPSLSLGGKPTHQAMWDYFNEWLSLATSSQLLSRIVTVGGHPLGTWFASVPGGATTISNWIFANAGFDLQAFAADRDLRNHISYHPSASGSTLSLAKSCEAVASAWATFEPDSNGSFPIFDQELLAAALDAQYRSLGSAQDWKSWLRLAMPAGVDGSALAKYLEEYPAISPSTVFSQAMVVGNATNDTADSVSKMICRAVVLARISLGSARAMIADTGASQSMIDDWFSTFLVNRGLWDASTLFRPSADLWEDMPESIESAEYAAESSSNIDVAAFMGDATLQLSQAERVLTWAFD